jgi:vancomycin aglycone glucosyltransferase
MRVLLSTYGSRGDVEPMAGLGVALQALGVEAVVSAPPDEEFQTLLARAGVPLAPAFMGVRDWIEWARQSGLSLPQFAPKMITGQYDTIATVADGCDAIVSTGLFPSTAAAHCVAEKLASITRAWRSVRSPCRRIITGHFPAPVIRCRRR